MINRSVDVRDWALSEVDDSPFDLAGVLMRRFAFTRQAAERHLRRLEAAGDLRSRKEGRRRRWMRATRHFTWPVTGLDEAEAFNDEVVPWLDVSPRALAVLAYGFTEMVNNVVEHSGSDEVVVQVSQRHGAVELWVGDNGVGAFRKVAQHFGLRDDRAAVLELAKGRVTTDPARHSGQGIFFTSRAMDSFVLWSNDLCLQRIRENVQTMARVIPPEQHVTGTLVLMKVARDTETRLADVFGKFAVADVDGFTKTRLAVRLCAHDGRTVVARSQGKRLMSGTEQFECVALDFHEVDEIGQGFADEVFRVWARSHPAVALSVYRANADVLRMVAFVRSSDGLPPVEVEALEA